MNHCKDCKFNSINAKKEGYETIRLDEHCIDCGCNLDYKTHCMDCACPKNFWEAVLTEEDANKLDNLLKEK